VSRRFAHEAKADEVAWLALDLLILLRAGGVVAGEVKITEGSTRLGHHLLELLLLLRVPKAVIHLVVAIAIVVLLGVVVLVGGVELLPLGAINDKVGGVAALNFLTSRAISSSGMLSYCSLKAADKEGKANSKADETMVLVGLASWPPTRALVIKALLVREASELGRPFLDNS
jgi:hypothetical protein